MPRPVGAGGLQGLKPKQTATAAVARRVGFRGRYEPVQEPSFSSVDSEAGRSSDVDSDNDTSTLTIVREAPNIPAVQQSFLESAPESDSPRTEERNVIVVPSQSKQQNLTSRPLTERKNSTPGGKRSHKPKVKLALPIKKKTAEVKDTNLLLRKVPFSRFVREIVQNLRPHDRNHNILWQGQELEALQEAAEAYLVGFFEDACHCAIHAKRVTIMPPDFTLVKRLRGSKL